MIEVAVLFARSDSVYKTMPGCDVWDIERDARKWLGGLPVVAHPPCRAWSTMRRFAKPRNGERFLATWAIRQVRRWGGVLEHPAGSRLWSRAKLPRPGAGTDRHGGWTLGLYQHAFGHRAEKKTILYIVGVGPKEIPALPAQRDAEGPRGTYGCACLDRDAVQCAAIRYGMDHWGEACQCLCHQWGDDDDNLG